MKRRFTEDSWRKEPWFRGLVSAVRSCKSETDVENLLRDIATLSELQALSERLEVARLLSRGLSYRQVAAETGASTTTVTRVANFLENGEGGYRQVLNTHRHHRMQVDKKPMKTDMVEEPQSTSVEPMESMPILPLEQLQQTVVRPAPVSPLQKYLDRRPS